MTPGGTYLYNFPDYRLTKFRVFIG